MSALEYDFGDLRKGEELHRLRGEMQRTVGGVVESLSLVEEMTKEVRGVEKKNAASHSNNNARPSSYLQMYCCGFISG